MSYPELSIHIFYLYITKGKITPNHTLNKQDFSPTTFLI